MASESTRTAIQWRRSPLPPDLLESLNQRSDTKAWLQTGGYLGSMVLTGSFAYWAWSAQNWWLMGLLLFLHGTLAAFSINAVHELVHGTVFRTAKLNTIFAYVFAFLGWINHRFFWLSHTEHHKYTLHAPDDLEVVIPITETIPAWLKGAFINFNAFKLLGMHYRRARGILKEDWEHHLLPPEATKKRSYVFNWSRFLLLGHGTIIVVSLATGQWIIPFLISLTPFYGYWLFTLCNNTQHVGLSEDVNDFRLNCRTFELNPILRFFYWHMNFHIEHHMYAAVPCYNLKKLHQAIESDLPRSPKGLLETWVEIGYIMTRQKEDPNYRYVPLLPEDREKRRSDRERMDQLQEKKATNRSPMKAKAGEGPSRKWECQICGFIYEEALGLPEEGIAPGTAWEDIPEDWSCPDCGVSKAEFDMVELV